MGILSALERTAAILSRRQTRRAPDARGAGEVPLRAEIFSPAQFDAHARAVASSHRVDPKPGPERLLHRLAENEAIVREAHRVVSEAVHRSRHLPQAAEWLLDNFYLIEEQIAVARDVFRPVTAGSLPRLRAGPLKGFPCVYDLALELVIHTDGRVDVDNLTRFVQAYQTVAPLNLGELWAVPVMARLALIENLSRRRL